jgi:uncharacterized membrane protein
MQHSCGRLCFLILFGSYLLILLIFIVFQLHLFYTIYICLRNKRNVSSFLAYVLYFEQEVLGRSNRLLSFGTTRTAQKTKQLWGHTDSKVIS